MGFMYSWSNIKRVLFRVAKLLAYMYTYTHTINKVNFSLCSWKFPWLLCILETSQNAARSIFAPYTYIATDICMGWTPLIVLLLCAISPLSSQGAKTCTARDMAGITTFHKKMANLHNDVTMQVGHCIRTRYKYSWGCCNSGVVLFRKWVVMLCDRSFYIWGYCNWWVVILPILRY